MTTRKLLWSVLVIAALAAVLVWTGGPGRFAAVGVAAAAWRYLVWRGGD